MICEDPGVSEVVVDRATGEELQLVNRTLEQFVACALAFEATTEVAERVEDDEHELATLASTLLGRLRQIDEASVRDENQPWAIAAEELGYGF